MRYVNLPFLPASVLVLLISNAARVSAITNAQWFVDDICNTKYPGFSTDVVPEAIQMAADLVGKLNSNDDYNEIVFQQMFHGNDGQKGAITQKFQNIAAMTQAAQPQDVHLIITCDNDAGFGTPIVRPKNTQNPKDVYNHQDFHMRVTRSVGAKWGCTGANTPIAHTMSIAQDTTPTNRQPWMDEGWQTTRSLVSICDRVGGKRIFERFGTLDKLISLLDTFQETNPNPQTQKVGTAFLNNAGTLPLLSRTVLHEFFHTRVVIDGTDAQIIQSDVMHDQAAVGAKGKAYGWIQAGKLPDNLKIKNNDNYAFQGQMPALFDKGWRLQQNPPEAFQNGLIEAIVSIPNRVKRYINQKCRDILERRKRGSECLAAIQ
ncbi:hypothetical protein B7463_g1017, partial [Scytalidium lignicola]